MPRPPDRIRPAIWLRALHKTASMFFHKYGQFLAEGQGRPWRFYSNNNSPPDADLAETTRKPYVLGPVRSFHLAEDWSFRFHRPATVALIRDPRDTLVSEYYSLGFTHGEKHFHEATKEMREKLSSGQMSIDEYALFSAQNKSPLFGPHSLVARIDSLETLRSALSERDLPLLVVRYEDMVTNFPAWSKSVLDFLDLPHLLGRSVAEFGKQFDLAAIERRGERMRHKRKIIPGDHVAKLKPETIAQLNVLFQSSLSRYYPEVPLSLDGVQPDGRTVSGAPAPTNTLAQLV